RYRVARIESILGVSLEKPEDRFQIQVAAEMYKLISED
ncbi:helix-turn-helix domain-containing protein, partial [Leclercia adecarboxylata]